MLRIVAGLFLLLISASAYGQSSILQGGGWAAGRVPMYVGVGTGQATVQDSGPAGGGTTGLGIKELLLTARGTGTPPFVAQGTGPGGTNFCNYDAPTSNATGYHYICMSPNATVAGVTGSIITAGSGGATSNVPLYLCSNGTCVTPGGSIAGLTVGTTTISGGTSLGMLYDNAGVLGNTNSLANAIMVTDGSGVPAFSTSIPITLPFSVSVFTQTGTGAAQTTLDVLYRKKIYVPEMFGGSCNPVGTAVGSLTDNTSAVQKAIDAAGLIGGATILFGPCAYAVTNLSINTKNVYLQGAGQQATTIVHKPTGASAALAFQIAGGGSPLFNTGVRDLSIGSADTTFIKTAISLIDVSNFQLENVNVSFYPTDGTNYRGGAGGSFGLGVFGRELSMVKNFQVYADNPIEIGINPDSATISMDSFHFQDFVGVAGTTNNVITVNTGTCVYNTTFDGHQNWIGGIDGLNWIDTTSACASYGLYLKGIKSEQTSSSATGYTVNIANNNNLWDLRVADSITGDRNGIKLRKVRSAIIDNFFFAPATGTIGLNADNTDTSVTIQNSFWNAGTTASIVGLNPCQLSDIPAGSSSALPPRGYFSTGTCAEQFRSILLSGSTSGTVTQSAQAVAGTPTVTWGTSTGTPAVTASSPLAIAAATGNITCPTCPPNPGTSGGVPYYSGTATVASSALLAANAIMLGGGAGAAPLTTTTGTGVVTALGVNIGSAGAFVTFNGALGTPSSGTVTNLTGTASININGTVGITTPSTVGATAIGVGAAAQSGGIFLSSTSSPTISGTAQGAFGTSTTNGLLFYGDGTTYDVDIQNRGNSHVCGVAGGTTNWTCANIIITAIVSDAAQTDNTVCIKSDGTLLKGSGTLGICLGTSSARYKRDIEPLHQGLAEIERLVPKSFYYLPGYGDDGAKRQYGLVAEDVIKVMPAIVGLDDKGRANSVDWAALTPVMINAIAELKIANDNLRAEVENLKKRTKR